MSQVVVSVMVPVYNRQDLLPACLNSLLAQSYQKFEVLLANDGSTDESLEICKKYAAQDQRFKVINHAANRGISFIRSDTLQRASGKYVALLDSDDLAHPERLRRQVERMEQEPRLVLLGSYVGVVDPAGKELYEDKMPITDQEIRWRLTFGNCLTCSSLMVRTESALRCGGFDATVPNGGEDMEFSSRILSQGDAAVLPEKLTFYRLHPTNLLKQPPIEYRQGLIRSVKKSIQRHLDLDVSEELAAVVFGHGNMAADPGAFAAGADLLSSAVSIIMKKNSIIFRQKEALSLGRIATISLFELAARHRRHTWWKIAEPDWLRSAKRVGDATGYAWSRDLKLLGTLHPRTFLWKLALLQ